MKIGEYIKQYRKQHDLSQRKFALQCGVSNGYISMLEKGENPRTHKPIKSTLDKVNDVARGMGMTLHELLSIVDDIEIDLSNEKTAPENGSGLSDKDIRLLTWFRSLPEEKQRAILIAQDAPEELF